MLFSAAKREKEMKEEWKRRDSEQKPRDEREGMQEKTFRKWLNAQIEKADQSPLNDLFSDLRDGTKLLTLLEVLTGQKLPREKGKTKVHHISNINTALQFLQENKIKVVNINSNDIADGNPKITLGLIWHIMQHYWQNSMSDAPIDPHEISIEELLLRWCRYSAQEYDSVNIKNFTSSWKDGLAFNALLHRYKPDLFDFQSVLNMSPLARLAHSFHVAENNYGVQKLLEPEDVASDHVDRRSVMTYIMCLFLALPHDTIEALDSDMDTGRAGSPSTDSVNTDSSSKRLSSSSADTVTVLSVHKDDSTHSASDDSVTRMKNYRHRLEEVLAWLLDAEDKLAILETQTAAENDPEGIKLQFARHQDFMIALTQNQSLIATVLADGRHIVKGGSVPAEDTDVLLQQMQLMNEKWESLRYRTMQRQSTLRETLMRVQNAQVGAMCAWLEDIERAIDKSQPVGVDPMTVKNQLEQYQLLQSEIEKQQSEINSLSNLVIVVNESGGEVDSDANEIQEKLADISKRWAGVCQWTEKRNVRLRKMASRAEYLQTENMFFTDWLDQRDAGLSTLKSVHHLTTTQEVLDQVQNLSSMQQDLENQYSRFETYTQTLRDVATALELDNPLGASQLRKRVEDVGHRWENLVTRMDEMSNMLGRVSNNKTGGTRRSTSQSPVAPRRRKSVPYRDPSTAAMEVDSAVPSESDNSARVTPHSSSSSSPSPQFVSSKGVSTVVSGGLMGAMTSVFKRHASGSPEPAARSKKKIVKGSEKPSPSSGATRPMDFKVRMDNFTHWVEKVEAVLVLTAADGTTAFDRRPLAEQQVLYQETESDVNDRQVDLEDLHAAGHNVVEKMRSNQEDPSEIELMLAELNSRWRDLHLLLADRKRKIQIAFDSAKFREDLLKVDFAIVELADWSEQFDPATVKDFSSMRNALQECTEKLEVVKAQEPEVESLQRRLEELCEAAEQDDDQVKKLQLQFDEFTSKWAIVVDRISTSLEALTEKLQKTSPPSFDQTLSELSEWVEGAEDFLGTPELTTVDNLDVMSGKVDRIRGLRVEMHELEGTVRFLRETAKEMADSDEEEESEAETKLDLVLDRWAKVERKLVSKTDSLEYSLRQFSDLDTKSNELEKWMDEVTVFLRVDEPAVGDVDTLKAQLQQCKGLVDDISTLRPKLERMESTALELSKSATPTVMDYLDYRMKELGDRWDQVVKLTTEKHRRLQAAFDSSIKVMDDIQALTQWLETVEKELNSEAAPTSGKELQSLVKKHRQFKEEFDQQSEVMESAVKLGQQMLAGHQQSSLAAEPWPSKSDENEENDGDDELDSSTAESSSLLTESRRARPKGSLDRSPMSTETAEQLERELRHMREQWDTIREHLEVRLKLYSRSFQSWKEFQELLAAEKICLDQLERKLAEPMRAAADAEEFSEQLDLLERLMEGNSGNNARLREIGNDLTSNNIIKATVDHELDKYEARRMKLMDPARERQEFLESGVSESQEFEQQLLNCQSWMQHVDYILTSRLESDILASDVPEEYKQLSQEFAEHDKAIGQLEGHIEVYKQEGKEQAALRLQEQLNHLKKQMTDCRGKLARFGRPVDIDSRLERTERILRDVEQGLEILRVHSDSKEDVVSLLDRAQRMKETLEELNPEIEYVVTTGHYVISESPTPDGNRPDPLPERLSRVQSQYDKLKDQLTDCRDELEKAEPLVAKLHTKETEVLNFLEATEGRLNEWETGTPTQSLEEDLEDVSQTLQELNRQEASLLLLDDCLREWRRVAEPETATVTAIRLESLHERWEELQARLKQWADSLREMQDEDSSMNRRFTSSASEMKNWLEKVERWVGDLQAKSAESREEVSEDVKIKLKTLYKESSEKRPVMDALRDSALVLMDKGGGYATQVEPDLTSINTRWQQLQESLTSLQGRVCVSPTPASSSPTAISQPGPPPVPSFRAPPPPAIEVTEVSSATSSPTSQLSTPGFPIDTDEDVEVDSASSVVEVNPGVFGASAEPTGSAERERRLAFSRAAAMDNDESSSPPASADVMVGVSVVVDHSQAPLAEAEAYDSPAPATGTGRTGSREGSAKPEDSVRGTTPPWWTLPEEMSASWSERLKPFGTTVAATLDDLRDIKVRAEQPLSTVDEWDKTLKDILKSADYVRQKIPKIEKEGEEIADQVSEDEAKQVRELLHRLRGAWKELESVLENDSRRQIPVIADHDLWLRDAESLIAVVNGLLREVHHNRGNQDRLKASKSEFMAKHDDYQTLAHRSEKIQNCIRPHLVDLSDGSTPMDPVMARLEERWRDLETQFRVLLAPVEETTIVSSLHYDDPAADPFGATESPSGIGREIAAIHAEEKDLRSKLKATEARIKESPEFKKGDYHEFSQQEDAIETIKENIEAMESAVGKLDSQASEVAEKCSDKVAKEQLMRLTHALRDYWAQVNQSYLDRYNHYLLCLNWWQAFHRDLQAAGSTLDDLEDKLQHLPEPGQEGTSLEGLEKQIEEINASFSGQEKCLRALNKSGEDLLETLSDPEASLLRSRLEGMNKRWSNLRTDLQDRRDRLEDNRVEDDGFREDSEDLAFWLDETETLLGTLPDPTDINSIADLSHRCREKSKELPAKLKCMVDLNKSSEKVMASDRIAQEVKQSVRTDVSELQSRLEKIEPEFRAKLARFEEERSRAEEFQRTLTDFSEWVATLRHSLEDYNNAVLYTPVRVDPNALDKELRSRENDIDDLSKTWSQLQEESKTRDSGPNKVVKKQMDRLLEDWAEALQLATQLRDSSMTSSVSDETTSGNTDASSPGLLPGISGVDNKEGSSSPEQEDPSKLYARIKKPKKRPSGSLVPAAGSFERDMGRAGRHRGQEDEDSDDATPEVTDEGEYATAGMFESSSGRIYPLETMDNLRGSSSAPGKPPTGKRPGGGMMDAGDFAGARQGDAAKKLSPKAQEQVNQVTQLRHWLTDAQREYSGTIDITQADIIRSALKKQQEFLDQLQTKRLSLIRLLENSLDPEVQHKAEILCREWERAVHWTTRRKKELARMQEDSRNWDNLRLELELWMQDTEGRAVGKKVAECTMEELQRELKLLETSLPDLDAYRKKMNELNERSNHMIETYSNDDSTSVSQVSSALNTKWSQVNDTLRVRRAVLEASLRGRKDFTTAVAEFSEWLDDTAGRAERLELDTSNAQLIKDTPNRKAWMEKELDLRAELDAHSDVFSSLQETGRKILESIESMDDRDGLRNRLDSMDARWAGLIQKSEGIRKRLETAQDQWEKLTTTLRELIYWVETREKELREQYPVGGDLLEVKQQRDFCQRLDTDMESKSPDVKEVTQIANSFLMQQDLRPKLHSSAVSDEDEDESNEAGVRRSSRRIAQQIRSESESLGIKFEALKERHEKWKHTVEEALSKMHLFDKAIKDADTALGEAEGARKAWTPTTDVLLDDLPNQLENAKSFQRHLAPIRNRVDDVNDHSSRLLAENVRLSSASARQLESLNSRYVALEQAIQQRVTSLQNAVRDFGPSSQHFLSGSVAPPWERQIAENRVPYFVHHDSEQTQWDHPKMTDLMTQLCEFNDVKFSAYRTGMKLRALQKKLCLDLLSLHELVRMFEQFHLRDVNDRPMEVGEMVMALLSVYEHLQQQQPDLVGSIAQLIDLCLNWLLNVYDSSRTGGIRVLSFKVALVVMCRAHLEDKYKYLFRQVSPTGTGVDQKKLALLLHDAMQIPRYLGEVAAFGGTNIEPSVRSCFEVAHFPQEISLAQFLDWLKCEPQSVVWLPVMHRIAAGETAKHQAKCNVCKMYPIIGLRYRCLRCFNFDMCQNCFFSHRKSKSHKLSHPMQEYCIASTSGEDVRDFSRMVRNKFKSKRYWKKNPRLGYLPVESVNEGEPIESRSSTPSNPATSDMHSRMEMYAHRLAEMERSNGTLGGDRGAFSSEDGWSTEDEHALIASYSATLGSQGQSPGTPKSPLQIVSAIDGMQKEEMESVVRQLEDENRALQNEYDRLKMMHNGGSDLLLSNGSGSYGRLYSGGARSTTTGGYPTSPADGASNPYFTSTGSLQKHGGGRMLMGSATLPRDSSAGSHRGAPDTEEDMLQEARALRKHKSRLETRMAVLEEHNKQLEAQLLRLKQIIEEQQSGNEDSGTPARSTPHITPLTSGHSTLQRDFPLTNGHLMFPDASSGMYPGDGGAFNGVGGLAVTDSPNLGARTTTSRVTDLLSMAEDIGRAMGSFVDHVTSDNEEEDDEDEEEETVKPTNGRNGYTNGRS